MKRDSMDEYGGHPLDLFEARAAAEPDAVAVVGGDQHWTYRELDLRANGIADQLRAAGAGPEDVVGVCLGRGPGAVAGLLGVLKAGAAYLPLVRELPSERLALMIRDARARVLLSDADHAAALPAGTPVVLLDGTTAVPGPAVERDEDSLTYVIYTSGSTGTPKGIAVNGRTLAHVLRFDRHRERADRVTARSCAQLASHGFDVWLQEAFVTLTRGGRLVLVDEETRRDPHLLLDLLAAERVERVYLSPGQLDQLALAFVERPVDLALRHLSVGGEALRLSAETRAFLAALDRVVLENQYGPSETHHATSTLLAGDPNQWPDAPPIGRPLPATRAYLLDSRLNPVPPGATGELYLSGDGVARGYHRNAALTAQRFVADPHRPGARMYRTGDLARRTIEGTLTYLGRTDDQIKIRGHRIEPAEIETALVGHASVARAVVVAREDGPGQRRLVAYVVPADSEGAARIDGAVLRDHLARRLPDYMVPAQCVAVGALPLNVNGKVDVRALPAPQPMAQDMAQEPRSVREQLLSELFAEVVGVPRAGIHSSFFDLGGHSLLATRLISRIRATLGVDVPVRRLFDSPTVAGLAASLDEAGAADGLQTLLPLRTGGTGDPLFCVHPVAGTSWCYAGLPRLLGPGRPVYGLQDPGLLDPAHADDGVAELAAHYVEAIRRVRPQGPYHLLGWSFGGLVAQEMAVRLRAAGEEVGLLCLLDSYPAESGTDSGRYTPVASGGPADRADELRRHAGLSVPLDEREVTAVHRSMLRNAAAMREFVPRTYDGDLTFVTATRERPADAPGWQDWLPFVTGTVTDLPVDCAHLDMMRPEPLVLIGAEVARVLAHQENPVPHPAGSTG
ncbi:MAG TPA: hypothetical protein DD420_04485 [Streptomyces sp.]|nr:hypothetical protein [Streptomyces sp.]